MAVAIVLTSVYFLRSHQPKSARIAEVKADTAQLRAQQAPLRREIKGLEEMAAREPEYKQALQLLERLIPSELAQPSLLVNLQSAADAAGVELVSVTLGKPEVPKGAPESHIPATVLVGMPLTVVVDGQYARITEVLRRVEVSDRAVLVGKLALSEADAGAPQLRGTWSGQVFALMPKEHPLVADATAAAVEQTASAQETPTPTSGGAQRPQGSS
jgi:Tfp pilus assembly protein PilO